MGTFQHGRESIAWTGDGQKIVLRYLRDAATSRWIIHSREVLAHMTSEQKAFLLSDLRRFIRSPAQQVGGLSWFELEDGKVEGPDGQVEDSVYSYFPVARSSAGWRVLDPMVSGGQVLGFGSSRLLVHADGLVGEGWRFIVRRVSPRLVPVSAGEPYLQLTGPLAYFTPLPGSPMLEFWLDGPASRLRDERSAEVIKQAYDAVSIGAKEFGDHCSSSSFGLPLATVLSVVSDASASSQTVDIATSDQCPVVRCAIAANRGADNDTLALLALDEDRVVRLCVAANPMTSPAVLDSLATDGDVDVRVQVLLNPRCPRETLAMAAGDASWECRCSAALSDFSSPQVLADLARSSEWQVAAAVAANPNADIALLEIFVEDPRREVQCALRANPAIARMLSVPDMRTDPVGWLERSVPGADLATRRAFLNRGFR